MGVDLRMEPYAKMCRDGLPESRIFDELGPESCSSCLTSTASGTSTPNTLPCKCRESHRGAGLAWRAEWAVSPTSVPGCY
jgi:hypothetical protein